MGERAWLCSLACFLAEALYVQGKYDGASRWVEVGREKATEEDREAQADWRCIRAKLLARQGRFDDAMAMVAAAALARRFIGLSSVDS
jgi:predicted nucleic acid-binding protein